MYSCIADHDTYTVAGSGAISISLCCSGIPSSGDKDVPTWNGGEDSSARFSHLFDRVCSWRW